MTNKKSTKRALLMSFLSLLLCVSMLVGTTFAWFTDSVTSGNNKIVAGNLDIELEHYKDGEWVTVNNATDLFTGNLWEPGHTEVVYLRLSNLGSLALKYQLGINIVSEIEGTNVAGETFKLSDYIYMGVVENAEPTYTSREAAIEAAQNGTNGIIGNGYTKSGTMTADAADLYMAVVVYMPETVGNEANYKTGTTPPQIDLGINLIATQLMAEEDSFGPDYDEDAWADGMVVYNADDLKAALANGGNILLGADITSENGFTVTEDTAINLNGYILTATGERAYLFTAEGDVDLTLVNGKLVAESTNGQVTGTGTSTGASSSVYFASTGKLTMEDVQIEGSVRGGHRAVEVYYGTAVLTNVDITTSYGSGVNSGSGANVTLNDCDITVNGMYSAPYNSVAFSVMGGGAMTINSGNYKMINDNTYATGNTHGGWVGIVMNSGGSLTINGGMYTNVPAEGFVPQHERAIIEAENLDPATATVNLYGGMFKPQYNKVVSGYGDVNYPVINAHLVDNGDGTWSAKPEGTEFVTSGLYKNGNTYYIESANGLSYLSENALTGNNGVAESVIYELMTDIDMGGANFSAMIAQRGDSLTFNGNGHTISNVNVVSGANDNTTGMASMFYCYPNSTLTVSNLTLENITVTADENDAGYAAAVVGYCEGATVLNNVDVVNATITAPKSSGMLVGHLSGSLTATNCDVTGTITLTAYEANGHYAGKYIGTMAGATALNSCTANVTVSGNLNTANDGAVYGRKTAAGSLTVDGAVQMTASTQDELTAAVNSGNNVDVTLATGNYTMPDGSDVNLKGKTLTIKGTKDTVIDVSAVDARDQFVTGATVVFEGVTLNFGKVNYMGFANTASLTYKNCTINGLQFLYGENVTFENCVLNSNGAEHCVWTYGAKNVSFTNCEFTYGDRGVNCYSDNDVTGGKQTVNFTNCTFTTTNTASEGAVEINSCYFSVGIEVNMEGCTAPAYGELAYVSRWDSTNGAKTTINIK